MKSVLISFVMFAAILGAMYFGVFEAMSSFVMYVIADTILLLALVFAFKVLGNPFTKDVKHGKKKR